MLEFWFQIILLGIRLSWNGRKWKVPFLAATDPDAWLAGVSSSGRSGRGPQGTAYCTGEPCGGLFRGAEDRPHPWVRASLAATADAEPEGWSLGSSGHHPDGARTGGTYGLGAPQRWRVLHEEKGGLAGALDAQCALAKRRPGCLRPSTTRSIDSWFLTRWQWSMGRICSTGVH